MGRSIDISNLSGWVAEVKAGGGGVKVLPRVLFEGWSLNDFLEVFADLAKMEALGDYIGRQLTVRVKGHANHMTLTHP